MKKLSQLLGTSTFLECILLGIDYFGEKVTDPYRWMEASPTDTKFLDFLKVQNDYTHAVLAPLTAARDKLLARLKELDNAVPVVGPPTRVGENIFFLQTNPWRKNR